MAAAMSETDEPCVRCLLNSLSLASLATDEVSDTVPDPSTLVAAALGTELGGDPDMEWRKKNRRGERGDVGGGLAGLLRTLTVLALVQALRRASKQAKPLFHCISSRSALRRRARLSSAEEVAAD